VVSSAAPSVVRWYSSQYANGQVGFSLNTLWIIVLLSIFTRIGAWMSFEVSGMWSATEVYAGLIHGLSHTRTTYFDENPSGRLINRLIRDFDELRSTAIIFAGDLLNATIEVFSIAVVGMFASPYVILLCAPLFFLFFYIQHYRASMMAHARRLSSVAISHVIARETDLIEGREIFLLYGKSKRLLQRMAHSFRAYTHASLMMAYIEAWGSFWIRMLAEIFSLCVLLFLIYAMENRHLSPILTGVIISSLFGITGSIGWLDFATGLISRSVPHLERVFEIMDLPKEESEERPSSVISLPCPEKGLVFQNYSMSYRKDSPLIFENLDLRFKPGLKTALIGRTGSGKSSLIQAIFRMVYVQTGDVFLNGESIFSVPARIHRGRFAMIPQSPYLFEGTIRSNLDPFNQVADEALKKILCLVGLELPLDSKTLEEGKNLSQGERQLICLARAMVSKKEFIILDEATSGLDPETDARMIQVLKNEFIGKTVITVAHRLDTIRDYDWVIELANGKVIREGKPQEFLF